MLLGRRPGGPRVARRRQAWNPPRRFHPAKRLASADRTAQAPRRRPIVLAIELGAVGAHRRASAPARRLEALQAQIATAGPVNLWETSFSEMDPGARARHAVPGSPVCDAGRWNFMPGARAARHGSRAISLPRTRIVPYHYLMIRSIGPFGRWWL